MLKFLLYYSGGFFLGWSLGANDSANVFGTAVSSRMVSYKTAVMLIALFVILGALIQGRSGIKTLSEDLMKKRPPSNLTEMDAEKIRGKILQAAMVITYSAALTVTIMTVLKMSVSTSHAVIGAIAGVGIMQKNLNLAGFGKVLACWIGTPIGGILFTFLFYFIFRAIFKKLNLSIFVYDPLMSVLLILCGCYGAYALGANNVANVASVFVGNGLLTVEQAAIFGGVSIAIGALTYAKPVMITIGKGIVRLDSFSAFVSVFAQSVTVHIFAIIGVPVSTSHAIVGAIIGIGLIKGVQTINMKTFRHIMLGWIATPFLSAIFAMLFYFIANIHYIP